MFLNLILLATNCLLILANLVTFIFLVKLMKELDTGRKQIKTHLRYPTQ